MQRHALTVLFALLAAGMAAVAGDAFAHPSGTSRLVVGVAAVVIGVWLATLSLAAFRRGR